MTTASAFFPRNKHQQKTPANARGGGRGGVTFRVGEGGPPWNSPAGLVAALLRAVQQLRAASAAALGALADSKATGELVERGAVLISRHAHVLCAFLGVLFCLYLQRAGYVAPGWGRARGAGSAGGGGASALDALHAFAMDSRLAMKDILRGARDSLLTLALAPVSATRLAVASLRPARRTGLPAPLPGDPAARAAIQRARAQRSAAYAAAKCGTEEEDVGACAALLDVTPDMGGALSGDSEVDLDTAWAASACGTPRANTAVCAALASLRAAGRAAQGQVATSVPPATGDVSSACTLALAASEARTAELVTVQAEVESRVKRLALVRAHCRGPALADTVDCVAKMADAEAAAAEDTARLEALTVRAEAASQRAYTLCMAARDRGSSATAAAAGLVDWLASEADALLAHAAALEEQRSAAAARAAVEAAKQGGAATSAGAAWAALARELEEEIAATTRVAASTRQEAVAASSAGRLFGRVYPPSSPAASWRSLWVSSVTSDQMTMAYAMAAMAAPLTALAMLSAAAAERLRLVLLSRRLRRGSGSDTQLDSAAAGQQAGLASDTWVALTGEAKVGGVLLADVSVPPQVQARLAGAELEGVEYEFVWTRSFRGVFEVVEAQHAPWYTLTRDDLGSRLAVTVSSVLPSGEYGPTASARTRTVKA